MSKTQTRVAPQAKPAAKSRRTTLAYASLLAQALEGKFGDTLKVFYTNAVTHHRRLGTVFPRSRLAKVPLLSPNEAARFLEQHQATSIPPGTKAGQRLFDEMMVQTIR